MEDPLAPVACGSLNLVVKPCTEPSPPGAVWLRTQRVLCSGGAVYPSFPSSGRAVVRLTPSIATAIRRPFEAVGRTGTATKDQAQTSMLCGCLRSALRGTRVVETFGKWFILLSCSWGLIKLRL